MSPFRSEFFWPSVSSIVAFGGDEGIRTPDPLRARQVLSQLSYTPIFTARVSILTLLFLFEVAYLSVHKPSKLNNALFT